MARATVMDEAEAAARDLAALREDRPFDEASLLEALDHAQARVHDTPELALELASACVTAATRAGLPAATAQGQYLLARIFAERGELPQALAAIESAREQWDVAGERLRSLRTNLGRMQVLDDLGRHHDAISVGESLLAALDAHSDPGEQRLRDELRATAWNNVGVAYSFLGDHEATVRAYERAEESYDALGLSAEVAKTRANRGIELLEIGRAREALAALSNARGRFADMGDRMWDAKCRGNVAQAHAQLGEIVAALAELTTARGALSELRADAESARLQANGARLYLMAGLHREALGEAGQAAQFLLAAQMSHDAAAASLTCALAALVMGDVDVAEPWLSRAKELFQQVGDRQSQARVLLAEADKAALQGDIERSRDLAHRAAAELRAGGWLVPLAWAHLRGADFGADDAEVDAALTAAGDLVARLQLPDLRYAYALRRATQARSHEDDATAAEFLRDAVQVVEHFGATLTGAELRTAFRDDHMAAHDMLVDVLVTQGTGDAVAQAGDLADRAKARTLADFVTGALGERWLSTSDSADAMVAQLRADLSSTYHAMHEHAEPGLYANLQVRAVDLERELTLHRLEAATRRGALDPVRTHSPLERPMLPADAGVPVISYHIAGDDLLVFVAFGGEQSVRRVPGARALIDEQLEQLVAQWSRFALGPVFLDRHRDTLLATATHALRRLYDVLVRPIRDQLDAFDTNEIVIVPHRNLHQVPFSALHDGTGALARRWAVTLSPTVAGAAAGAIDRDGPLTLFAVADAAAPAISAEAASLGSAWPEVTSYLDADATSAAFRSAVPGPAVLHVACHGQYRHTNPMFSALQLADRWVTASELLELDFGGALVVLSACETGKHASSSTEPVGLAWAFLAAGAAGAVVSQWRVDDDVTARLMTELYAGLAQGLPPATALRAAQLAVAEDLRHPYYWAPFSFVTSTHPSDRGSR